MDAALNQTSLRELVAAITQPWVPYVVGRFNDLDVKLARFEGDYVWHVHEATDELFVLVDGSLRIEMRVDGHVRHVDLTEGGLFVVPRGVEHRPVAPAGAGVMMIEPRGTLNVGDRAEALPAHIRVSEGEQPRG